VRSLQLQAALTEFLAQAGARLHADVLTGQEVPFELATQTGRGRRGASPLYCYQPLTDAYVAERFPSLRGLDAYAPAAALLDAFDGLDRYLLSRGLLDARERRLGGGPGRGRCDAALLALLQEVCAEQTDFDDLLGRHPERLERALERLEDSAYATAAAELTLVATLHGLTISSPEIPLTRGLMIAQTDALHGAPEQALGEPGSTAHDHLLVVFAAEDPDPRTGLAHGIEVVRELLRALRLFGDGRISLGSLAWTRVGSAPWSPVALGRGGRPHGMLLVSAEQEDELRAFCNLVSRRAPHENEIAWALQRFELGCERASEYEGISDHLLALRALLGGPSQLEPADRGSLRSPTGGTPRSPTGGTPDGLLAGRLAALCATPEQRTALTERTLRAIALEREAIAGAAVERTSGLAVARELSDHLRALLRDMVCGHLPPELVALADELLLSGEELTGDEQEASEVLHVAV
jgi:hypothetical protein